MCLVKVWPHQRRLGVRKGCTCVYVCVYVCSHTLTWVCCMVGKGEDNGLIDYKS